ncbi:MAG: hypothetical protein V3V99_11385 [candidate division Zixibacteria bacterium]
MSDMKLQSVNWQDGMLINKKHLSDQEKYFEELIRWHALRVSDNFGLIRKSASGQGALSLNLTLAGNRLRVEVNQCQAVTSEGYYINVDENRIIKGEADVNATVIPVYLAVNPEAKKPGGDPEPSEDIPRLPYLTNDYSLHVGTPPDLPQGCFIQIARLNINGSEVVVAPDYYPPCLNIFADSRLSEKASELKNRVENLLSLSTRAHGAITVSGTLKGESSGLQIAFKETLGRVILHLAANNDGFVTGSNAGHPLDMIVYFKKLFRVVSTLLNLYPALKDYLNEKFFTRELRSDIGSFLASIDSFILMEYNHQDIGGMIQAIDGILNPLRDLFAFLAQTRKEELGEQAMATETLTYSGKTYRNLAYSASRLEQVGELSYLIINITSASPVSDTVILMSKSLFSDSEWRNMQVRLGINEARGLGETDPVDIDTLAFGNKVALHPRDLLESSSVHQMTMIFRGAPDSSKFDGLGQMDLIIYSL